MFKLIPPPPSSPIPSKMDVVALCDVCLLCTHTHPHPRTRTPQKEERRHQEYGTEKHACRTTWGHYIGCQTIFPISQYSFTVCWWLPNNISHIAVFIHCLLMALPSAGLHTNALQSYRHWGHSQALPISNQAITVHVSLHELCVWWVGGGGGGVKVKVCVWCMCEWWGWEWRGGIVYVWCVKGGVGSEGV